MNWLGLRNNRLKLKTFRTITTCSRWIYGIYLNFIKMSSERCQHVSSSAWKHLDFDQLCPNNLPKHRIVVVFRMTYKWWLFLWIRIQVLSSQLRIFSLGQCQSLKQSLVYYAFYHFCNEMLSWNSWNLDGDSLVSDNVCNILNLECPKNFTRIEI